MWFLHLGCKASSSAHLLERYMPDLIAAVRGKAAWKSSNDIAVISFSSSLPSPLSNKNHVNDVIPHHERYTVSDTYAGDANICKMS